MLQEERHQRIRNLLATFSRIGVDRIAQDLQVSRETVRRDLLELEALGELRRVHGGAVSPGATPEPPLAERLAARQKEKRAIAKAAAALLKPGQTLFLDAGSTTLLLAEELATLSGLLIVTNSVQIALKLAAADEARGARHNETVLLGGSIDAKIQATHGDGTIAEIHRYNADLALLSPVALHPKQGAMSFHRHEAAVARAMAAQAQQLVILADHSKIGAASRLSYARPIDIGTVITDARAARLPALTALRKTGPRVILA